MRNMKFWRTALVATLVLTVMLSVTGGTIAWVTDSVESKSNKIEAGNLDVELYMYNAITGEYDNISKAPNAIFGGADSLVAQNNNADTLWEPGKTQVAYLMIKNEGNLALQYNVDLIVKDSETDKDLYKAMRYSITNDAKGANGVQSWNAGNAVVAGKQDVSGDVSIAVGAEHYFALSIHMDEAAGNEYQNGSIDFDLVVNATQDNVEEDSFGPDYDKVVSVSTAAELVTALASNEPVVLMDDISFDKGIVIPEGGSIDGNGKTITYSGTDYTYHLVKLNTGAELKNVTFNNYRVRTEDQTNGVVTMENVKINMDNDLTGLDISRGVGVVKLTKVVCKGITDEAHLDPKTQVQVEYTPYGDVLLGTKWGLEATDCEFGSLHGWNTTNGSNVSLNNTTYTVFRMHYWPNRVLYIDGVETAWSESGAIPVAHDVGGCWSVQPEFK